MKVSDLAAIRARCEAATPGPWTLATDIGCPWNIEGAGDVSVGQAFQLTPPHRNPGQADRHANAAFIAHARSDIPALLAEVQRLKGLVEAAYKEGIEDGRSDVNLAIADDAEWWLHSNAKRQLEGL